MNSLEDRSLEDHALISPAGFSRLFGFALYLPRFALCKLHSGSTMMHITPRLESKIEWKSNTGWKETAPRDLDRKRLEMIAVLDLIYLSAEYQFQS